DEAVLEQPFEDGADEIEVEESRDEVDADEEQQSDQHLDGARAREEAQHVVERHRDDDDLDDVQEPGEDEAEAVEELSHRGLSPADPSRGPPAGAAAASRIASATARARRTGATSWTRKMRA